MILYLGANEVFHIKINSSAQNEWMKVACSLMPFSQSTAIVWKFPFLRNLFMPSFHLAICLPSFILRCARNQNFSGVTIPTPFLSSCVSDRAWIFVPQSSLNLNILINPIRSSFIFFNKLHLAIHILWSQYVTHSENF